MTEKHPITVDDLHNFKLITEVAVSPDGAWIVYVRKDVDFENNAYVSNLYVIPAADDTEPLQLTYSGKDMGPVWSPDSTELAFVSARSGKGQIYLLPVTAPGGEARLLVDMPNGASSPAFSADGTQIAFLSALNAEERAKEGEESDDKPTPPTPEDEAKRFDPRVIDRLPYRVGTAYLSDRFQQVYVMTLGDMDAKPRRLTDIDTDYGPPTWTPDGSALLLTRVDDLDADEPGRHQRIYRMEVASGEMQPLTDPTYTTFGAPCLSPDGQWIAFVRAPRKGLAIKRQHLAVIHTDGSDEHSLGDSFDRTVKGLRWQGESLLFSADSEGTTGLYRVSPANDDVKPVAVGDFAAGAFDVHGNGLIAYSATTHISQPELFIVANQGEQQQRTQIQTELLDRLTPQPSQRMTYTTEGGVEIEGWYLLPHGYEEGKAYPLVVDVHGGPHVMWSNHDPLMWQEWQLLAARGYAVFFCNPRGSDGYGQAFRDALFANWGPVAMTDIMTGVDLLIERGIADADQLFLTGGSYGGYMTAWVLGHTDRFRAAVTQRGVYSLLSFFGTTDITTFLDDEYGADPLSDPQMMWEHSPLAHAHKIKTPLLILHSENDFRVPISEAEQLYTYVKRSGTPVQFVRYPRDGHELSRSGEPKHRADRLNRMVDWFDKYRSGA